MSRRSEQIESTLREAIQIVLTRGINDPRVTGLLTVTSVRLDSSLRTAQVSVSVLPEQAQHLSLIGIRHAAAFIRREVGDRVSMARVPELVFLLDESLKRQAGVLGALARARDESEAAEARRQAVALAAAADEAPARSAPEITDPSPAAEGSPTNNEAPVEPSGRGGEP